MDQDEESKAGKQWEPGDVIGPPISHRKIADPAGLRIEPTTNRKVDHSSKQPTEGEAYEEANRIEKKIEERLQLLKEQGHVDADTTDR